MNDTNSKYQVGQTVTFKTRKTGQLTGTIEEVQRIFKRVDGGRFVRGGLTTFENDIERIVLPHTFDGETLTVEYPEQKFGTFTQHARTEVSKFYTYGYTIRVANHTEIKNYRVLTDEAAIDYAY